MLFSKSIEPKCAYCQRGKSIEGDSILCIKKGIMEPGDSCSAFRYDPLKRVPPRPITPDFSRLPRKATLCQKKNQRSVEAVRIPSRPR